MRKVKYFEATDDRAAGWYTLTDAGNPDIGPYSTEAEAEDAHVAGTHDEDEDEEALPSPSP